MSENAPDQSQPKRLKTNSGFNLQVEGKIGRGGYANVFRARLLASAAESASQDESNLYALKLFKPGEQYEKAWQLEAKMGELFQNEPHIVRVLESGIGAVSAHHGLQGAGLKSLKQLFQSEEEQGYLLMEYAKGGSLERHTPLPPHEAVRVFGGIASALDAIHSQGLVYRDLKDRNVMVTGPEDRALYKLGDMGAIDKSYVAGKQGTRQKQAIGTETTIAPEAKEGAGALASDIYSFGILLGQTLTGREPKRRNNTILPLEELANRANLPMTDHLAAFQPVIDKATQYSPADRYESAAAMLDAVHEAHAKGQEAVGKAAVHIPYRYKPLDEQGKQEGQNPTHQTQSIVVEVTSTQRYTASANGQPQGKKTPNFTRSFTVSAEGTVVAETAVTPPEVAALFVRLNAKEQAIAKLELQLGEMQRQLTAAAEANDELRAKLHALHNQQSTLLDEIATLRAEYGAKAKALENEAQANAGLETLLNLVRNERDKLKKERDELRALNKPIIIRPRDDKSPDKTQKSWTRRDTLGLLATITGAVGAGAGYALFDKEKADKARSPAEEWTTKERLQNKAAVTDVLLEVARQGDLDDKYRIATLLASHSPKESASLIFDLAANDYFADDSLRELAKLQPDLAQKVASKLIKKGTWWEDKVAGAIGPTFAIHRPYFARKLYANTSARSKEARVLYTALHAESNDTIASALDSFYQSKDYDSVVALTPVVAARNPSALIQFTSTLDTDKIFNGKWNGSREIVYQIAKELILVRPDAAESLLKRIEIADMKDEEIYSEIPRLAVEFLPSHPEITEAAFKRSDKNWYSVAKLLQVARAPYANKKEEISNKHLQAWYEFMRQPTNKKLAAKALALFKKENDGWKKANVAYMIAYGSQY